MFAKIKRALLTVWAVLSALAVIAAVIVLRQNRRTIQREIEEDAENAKEKSKTEIEQTPAADLAAASACADTLRRERQSITERFRNEVQAQLNKKLHSAGSTGTP